MSEIKHGPRRRSPRKPNGTQIPMRAGKYQVSFTPGAHDHLVQSHGVRLVHMRAIPDPRGMTSRGDNHAVGGTSGQRSSDQFIYKEVGIVQAFFSNNSDNVSQQEVGQMVGATAYITLPEFYEKKRESDEDCPVLVHPYDRFYLKDVEVRVVTHEFVESNSTGVDRLSFPATCVEHVIDANGKEYNENEHFKIDDEGNIVWISQLRPGWNPTIGKGTVYAIRYRYTPYFILDRIIHEIRVALITDMATGLRSVRRMPYEIQVVREFVFKDRNRDPNAPVVDPRYQDAPSSGGQLGPQ